MVQVYKLLCLAVSALILLQSTDANSKEKDDQSPFLKNYDKLVHSKIVRKTSEAAELLKKELKQFGNEFEEKLNEDYRESLDKGGIHLIPKSVTHNVIQPTAAVTKIVAKRAATLADHFADDVKETYDKYLDNIKSVPGSINNKVIQPGTTATMGVVKRTSSLVDNFAGDVKDTYGKYKENYVMSSPIIAKPIMFGKAITKVTANNAKKYFQMGKSFWNDEDVKK